MSREQSQGNAAGLAGAAREASRLDRAGPAPAPLECILREVVERLAPIDRTPCSPGERDAAQWLLARLRQIPGVQARLEEEPSWGTFPPTATALGLLGLLGAALALRGRRTAAALLAAGSLAGIVDEAQNGPRILRRLVRRRRTTLNLVARVGERAGGWRAGAPRPIPTLVVLAHHDAPQTGFVFDQTIQRRIYELAPALLERFRSPLPLWWIGLSGPLLTLATAATRRREFARAALLTGDLGTAGVADVWRSPTVAGANDNLSGVAALVALAEMLRERPVPGLRVLLVSCGAEETLQDGVRAFLARHREELEPARTVFVNLDTVGSPHLTLLEGEGPVWMEDYAGPWLREALAACAERLEISLRTGFRARASTDSVIPSRGGYPTATLVSMTDWYAPANYHLPSDIPANLEYDTVADATRLLYELARMHARDGGPGAERI